MCVSLCVSLSAWMFVCVCLSVCMLIHYVPMLVCGDMNSSDAFVVVRDCISELM